MTPDEKAALNHRLATLASVSGIPEDLLWQPADLCPQGHHRYVAVEHPDYEGSSAMVEDVGWSAGALCLHCLYVGGAVRLASPQAWMDERMYPAFDVARALRQAHQDDPTWHPEWRVGRQPRDFMDPAVLYPVLQAWIDQDPGNRWIGTQWKEEQRSWGVWINTWGADDYRGHATHAVRPAAEALAFVAALESADPQEDDG